MNRPFITGVHRKRETIHWQRITRAQMQRLLRDIFAPEPITLDEAKAQMVADASKVQS